MKSRAMMITMQLEATSRRGVVRRFGTPNDIPMDPDDVEDVAFIHSSCILVKVSRWVQW